MSDRGWTPERRRQAARLARAAWDATPPEEREARAARQRATFEARYPHRVRLYAELKERIATGDLVAEPCDRCGGEGRMQLRYDDEAETVEVVGWRCYPCRRASE